MPLKSTKKPVRPSAPPPSPPPRCAELGFESCHPPTFLSAQVNKDRSDWPPPQDTLFPRGGPAGAERSRSQRRERATSMQMNHSPAPQTTRIALSLKRFCPLEFRIENVPEIERWPEELLPACCRRIAFFANGAEKQISPLYLIPSL